MAAGVINQMRELFRELFRELLREASEHGSFPAITGLGLGALQRQRGNFCDGKQLFFSDDSQPELFTVQLQSDKNLLPKNLFAEIQCQ